MNFYARYDPSKATTTAQTQKSSESTDSPRPAKRVKKNGGDSKTLQEASAKDRPVKVKENGALDPGDLLHEHPISLTEATSREAEQLPQQTAPSKARRADKEKRKKKKSTATEEQVNGEDVSNPNDRDAPTQSDATLHHRIRRRFEQSKAVATQTKASQASEAAPTVQEGEGSNPAPTGLVPLPQPEDDLDEDFGQEISALPAWLRSPLRVLPGAAQSFQALGLNQATVAALKASGVETTLPVQAAVLPLLLPGPEKHLGDLCIAAATGSGKTLGYVLPILEDLRKLSSGHLQALIVVPTRELVHQVRETFRQCLRDSAVQIETAVGNRSLRDEQRLLVKPVLRWDPEAFKAQQERVQRSDLEWVKTALEQIELADTLQPAGNFVISYESQVDVLICTPGRLVDHLRETTGFTLDHLRWLVVDEADRLLEQSFQDWIDTVLPAVESLPPVPAIVEQLHLRLSGPRRKPLRKIILSATMTNDISKLLSLRLRRPRLVVLEGTTSKREQQIELQHTSDFTAELPPKLEEHAIQIKEAGEKPLYLVKMLLRCLSGKSNGTDRLHSTPDKGSTQSNVDDTSSSGSSIGSDSSDGNDDSDSSSSEASQVAPAKQSTSSGVLVFVNTNENALRLVRLLQLLMPYFSGQIASLTKSTATSSGRRAISAFQAHRLQVLVATDRASRGLDLAGLAHVVNYDMPRSVTSYVHRIGRTARAGQSGTGTTLVAHHEARWFWNEIARLNHLRRAGKVMKVEGWHESIQDTEREHYAEALRQLGKEAKGLAETK